jgi:hypothetical protein
MKIKKGLTKGLPHNMQNNKAKTKGLARNVHNNKAQTRLWRATRKLNKAKQKGMRDPTTLAESQISSQIVRRKRLLLIWRGSNCKLVLKCNQKSIY